MKSLVFFNNKGGVGKTTLACNVVSYLNIHRSKRALLVDADPQCNATQILLDDGLLQAIYLGNTPPYKTLYSYLKPLELGDATVDTKVTPLPASENSFKTDLIPGHPNLSLVEDQLSTAWSDLRGSSPVRGFRITNWLSQIFQGLESSYDLVIFDVGPSLGALNRTVLLNCDYIVTPFGSDIFSLLGIRNISSWIKSWRSEYDRAVRNLEEEERYKSELSRFAGVTDINSKTRFVGYSVQQYVMRRFKTGPRPVKAYDDIMRDIPSTAHESLDGLAAKDLDRANLELGHIPFLYSLVPLAQSNRVPIHELVNTRAVSGAQVKQVAEYKSLMDSFCDKLLRNMGLLS